MGFSGNILWKNFNEPFVQPNRRILTQFQSLSCHTWALLDPFLYIADKNFLIWTSWLNLKLSTKQLVISPWANHLTSPIATFFIHKRRAHQFIKHLGCLEISVFKILISTKHLAIPLVWYMTSIFSTSCYCENKSIYFTQYVCVCVCVCVCVHKFNELLHST